MVLDRAPGEPLREVLAEVEGLRVQIVTIGSGQRVRWHEHTAVSDTIIAVVGSLVVETAAPPAHHRLEPGERVTIPAGTAHTVSGGGQAVCRLLNLHSGGVYDFHPLPSFT